MRHAPLPGYRRPGGTAHSGGRGLTHAPARRAGDLDEYKRLSQRFSGTGAVKKWGDIDEDILEYCDPKCAVGFAVIASKLEGLGGYVKQHLRARHMSNFLEPVTPDWQDLFLRGVRVQEWACQRWLSPKTRPSPPV